MLKWKLLGKHYYLLKLTHVILGCKAAKRNMSSLFW